MDIRTLQNNNSTCKIGRESYSPGSYKEKSPCKKKEKLHYGAGRTLEGEGTLGRSYAMLNVNNSILKQRCSNDGDQGLLVSYSGSNDCNTQL